jgi:hypothetical protein
MGDAMRELAGRLAEAHPTAGPVLFTCRHRVYGVGMFDVAAVLEGDAIVAEAGRDSGAVDVLVGTVSACHGAASLLHLGAFAGSRPERSEGATPQGMPPSLRSG